MTDELINTRREKHLKVKTRLKNDIKETQIMCNKGLLIRSISKFENGQNVMQGMLSLHRVTSVWGQQESPMNNCFSG